MGWLVLIVVAFFVYFHFKKKRKKPDLSVLPPQFIVFDLETTGLKPDTHEIIEIGAIKVTRDSDNHATFQTLIKPRRKIPRKIAELTGITQEMVDADGKSLEEVLPQFLEFVGDLPLVAYNATFDMGFLKNAIMQTGAATPLKNQVSCALTMARQAWPGRKSYRLVDMAKDGGLSDEGTHRALGDCKRAMIVYSAAATILGTT